jgi:thymidylate synthase
MIPYLNLLQDIVDNGSKWLGNRTSTRTSKVFGRHFVHDMREGFPLLTTKTVNHLAVFVELEGFIKGITSKSWYQARRCYIWDEWCNPQALKVYDFNDIEGTITKLFYKAMSKSKLLKKERDGMATIKTFIRPDTATGSVTINDDVDLEELKEITIKYAQVLEDDLGPIYGAQWRGNTVYTKSESEPNIIYADDRRVDQLAYVIDQLQVNPLNRRLIVDAWNVEDIFNDCMALPPCHRSWQVDSDGEYFDLQWDQRSVDTFLGLPFNIASYAMLMLLIEKETGLKARHLNGALGNVHIYENHVDQVATQLNREPTSLPTVKVTVPEGKEFSIYDWTADDVIVEGYNPQPFIKAPVSV